MLHERRSAKVARDLLDVGADIAANEEVVAVGEEAVQPMCLSGSFLSPATCSSSAWVPVPSCRSYPIWMSATRPLEMGSPFAATSTSHSASSPTTCWWGGSTLSWSRTADTAVWIASAPLTTEYCSGAARARGSSPAGSIF